MTPTEIREQIREHRQQIVALETQLTTALKNPPCVLTVKTSGGRLIEEVECLYEEVQAHVCDFMDSMKLREYEFYGYPMPPSDNDAPTWWDGDAPVPCLLSDGPQCILTAVTGYAFSPIYHFTVRLA